MSIMVRIVCAEGVPASEAERGMVAAGCHDVRTNLMADGHVEALGVYQGEVAEAFVGNACSALGGSLVWAGPR